MFFPPRSVRVLVVSCVLMLVSADAARAAKQFRLKFKAGDVFKLTMVQDTKQTITVIGREQQMPMKMTMDMTWKVDKINPDETLDMVQIIERVRMTMNLPGQGELTIDTDKEGDGGGNPVVAMMSQMFKPMLKTEFRQKMNRQGKILAVSIPDKAMESVGSNPMLKKFFSKEAMKEMISKMSPVLPEQAIDKGYSWEAKTETPAPFGKMVIKTKITYQGEEQRENRTLDKFGVVMDMSIEAGKENTGMVFKIKDQKGSGTMYFDSEAGYFVENIITQDMTIEGQAAGQAFTQKLHTETRITTVPAGGKK